MFFIFRQANNAQCVKRCAHYFLRSPARSAFLPSARMQIRAGGKKKNYRYTQENNPIIRGEGATGAPEPREGLKKWRDFFFIFFSFLLASFSKVRYAVVRVGARGLYALWLDSVAFAGRLASSRGLGFVVLAVGACIEKIRRLVRARFFPRSLEQISLVFGGVSVPGAKKFICYMRRCVCLDGINFLPVSRLLLSWVCRSGRSMSPGFWKNIQIVRIVRVGASPSSAPRSYKMSCSRFGRKKGGRRRVLFLLAVFR